MVPDPLPGALGPGLRRPSGEVGWACLSWVVSVGRVVGQLGRPLGIGVRHLVGLHPSMRRCPTDGEATFSAGQQSLELDDGLCWAWPDTARFASTRSNAAVE